MLIVVLLYLFVSGSVRAQSPGTVSGTVVDQETGETLIGVNVRVDDTSFGTPTDVEGYYRLSKLQPGTYTLIFSYIGYQTTNVTGVEVAADSVTTVDIQLASESVELGEVTVEARAIRNTEAILLKDRQKAASMSNAISAEEMDRVGSSTAADAMQKVSGASVVDGKYVNIRGLGDRYINTQLNGAELPSADPNENSVPLDLFPAPLLDNIVTTKTFTPDKPGNFTGGSVNIGTKAYPESLTLSLSTSISHNSEVGIGNEFLSYAGGEAAWLGMNGGSHRMPAELDRGTELPHIDEAWTDEEKAQTLDRLSRAFNAVMTPEYRLVPLSQSYKGSLGGQTTLLGNPLGVVGSVNYSRKASGYDGGTSGRYMLSGKVSSVDQLTTNYRLSDVSGTDEVLWNGMLNLNYRVHPEHTVGLNVMYNHSGTSRARYQTGPFPQDLSEDGIYETRTLHYTERDMNAYQMRGKHHLGERSGPTLEWNSTFAKTRQSEPDLKLFTNNYTVFERESRVDTVFSIRPSIYPLPARYFRNLEEESITSEANLSIPFRQWGERRSTLKFGGMYTDKSRIFRERRFRFKQDVLSYRGNPNAFWSAENVGILEKKSTDTFFRFGHYIEDATQESGSYDGQQDLYAAYSMVDIPLMEDIRFIGGIRFERTRMTTVSQDTSAAGGNLETNDWLPSANMVYTVTDDMNIRLAYGRTLARPTFRELAPYASFNFVGDYIFIGNPALDRTITDNYDVRWEWFIRRGEIAAVSGFYKQFSQPIERVILNTNGEIQYRNVDHARLFGLEFELRKRLDQIISVLEQFSVGTNLTLTHSEAAIAPSELEIIRAFDSDASDTRDMQGQSPYVVNFDLTYNNRESGIEAGAYYHVFGPRQVEVSMGGTPDLYEQPRHAIDVNFSKDVWAGFVLNASISNLLNEAYRVTHTYKGRQYASQFHPPGRSISVGLSYGF
jgi:outer membrane receptor protein involved in Fe transport